MESNMMENINIKFYLEDKGYDLKQDDSSLTIKCDEYISDKSLEKILDVISSVNTSDAIGLDRVKVTYWENLEYREEV
jgi:hypothetical protein